MQESINLISNMKRLHSRNHDEEELKSESYNRSSSISNRKCSLFTSTRFASLFLLTLFLFSLSFILPHSPSTITTTSLLQLKQTQQQGLNIGASDSAEFLKDTLLGGLLAAGFDERSCLSRYHSVKGLSGNPSPYLISRLRKYEALHKECGPYTKSYNKTVKDLRSGLLSESPDCKYVVWISYSGLGNRILTLASAFLYALLTNRVLLVDPGVDMVDLFCEPFPDVSWFLPPDFPLNSQLQSFNQKSDQCHGKMLKNKSVTNSKVPSFVYLHLAHDYDDEDKLFFCDEDQKFLHKVPWLVMRTDNYFTPSLFLMPSFEHELSNLFPNKETVFHFLGKYLFHPTNKVWGLVIRYYEAYLTNVDERVGIQIRVFDTRPGPFQHVLDQILACTLKENLLPNVVKKHDIPSSFGKFKSKAVLMTSLSSGYFEKVRDMYWEFPTVTGEVVGVYQPSHEGHQQTGKQIHNQKAWAEMYLLSLTDVLVTSSWSTFGYVAQGLGGLKPWILYKPENETAPDPPCQHAMSMEPCFHAPPFYDCKAKRGTDTGALVPHVRHCEDMSWGLKLVDN
ncbi:galactoside 2-alpha-L-fucosyltransferase-like [Cicer arietinum]|uniref:Fucosyltransferase n=1 Tax=Cicer arietinum TaxID=3827 RepID=A0A1S2Y675_CICAR|nr:galactoside 2-alpha-L-fucosyltransferase-like [Cicer arietinum]